ncbi:hypothetical protein [Mycobacterium malmoense]|nr:hypothetical protein [Mycobacterium malmoense]
MQNSSIVSLLRERAGLPPDDLAFGDTDHGRGWRRGFAPLDA